MNCCIQREKNRFRIIPPDDVDGQYRFIFLTGFQPSLLLKNSSRYIHIIIKINCPGIDFYFFVFHNTFFCVYWFVCWGREGGILEDYLSFLCVCVCVQVYVCLCVVVCANSTCVFVHMYAFVCVCVCEYIDT